MNQRSLVLMTMVFILLLAACGGSGGDPNTPPSIVYGEDVCAHCGMIISDERFAAGLVLETESNYYEHLIFDDIGDMVAYVQETGIEAQVVSAFVHDYHSRAWIDATKAHYVKASGSQTPMGSGLLAFHDRAEAEAEAQSVQGELLDFEALHGLLVDHGPMGHSHRP